MLSWVKVCVKNQGLSNHMIYMIYSADVPICSLALIKSDFNSFLVKLSHFNFLKISHPVCPC